MKEFKISIKRRVYEETLETEELRTYYDKSSYKYIKVNDKKDLEKAIKYIKSLEDYRYHDEEYTFITDIKYSFKINNKKISKDNLLMNLKKILSLLYEINAKNQDINRHALNTTYYTITIGEIEEINQKIDNIINNL